MSTNPIIEQVAERLYLFSLGRLRRIAPINSYSPEMSRRATAAGKVVDDFSSLTDRQKSDWYIQAADLIAPMLAAAAEAYSTSGCQVLPEHLDVETEEAAEKVTFRFVEWRRAFRSNTEQNVNFPNHAVGVGLAALAALRAAFGWSPTMTSPEIVENMRADEAQTPDGDQVRLHLASAHGHPISFGAGDVEADELHKQMHRDGESCYAHDPANLEWSEDEIEEGIVRTGLPREQFDRPKWEHIDRAPHTVEFDALRLHLLSAHCLINAAELRDHQVVDAHEHEHTGPGTIRNHPREDRTWTIEKVNDVLDDLSGEPDEQRRYLGATGKVMARLKGFTS